MRQSTSAIPQSRTLMRGLILGDKYAKEAAQEMAGKEMGIGKSAVAALNDAGALWEVETRPAYFEMPGEGFLPSGSMWVTRTDTNRPVTPESVSKTYQTFQNRAMGEWADLLVDLTSTNHVGAVVVNGGRKVMVLIRLQASQVAYENLGEHVIPTMAVGTGHDGGTSLFASTMAFEQVCANTLHWSIPNLTRSVSIRHTRNMEIQIAEAQRALNLAETWSKGFDDEIRLLLDQEVSYVRAEQLLETVWPTAEAEDLHERTRTNRIYAHNGVMEARADEKWAPYRDTGWGFMSALTEWEQWEKAGTRLSGPERHLRSIAGGEGGTDSVATRFRNLILAN
jgi:phage/plasmid-like protein (TIGR03299 family)